MRFQNSENVYYDVFIITGMSTFNFGLVKTTQYNSILELERWVIEQFFELNVNA